MAAARRGRHSIDDGLAVGREGDVEETIRPLAVAGGVELLETAHDEEIGLDAVGRCPDAVPEAEHRERMAARIDDLEAFRPAHPVRHLDRIEADVLEAVPRIWSAPT